MNCFDCDLPMVRGNYACQVDIKGSVVELENPGWWCSTCQAGVHTDEDRIMLRKKIDNYPNAPPVTSVTDHAEKTFQETKT